MASNRNQPKWLDTLEAACYYTLAIWFLLLILLSVFG